MLVKSKNLEFFLELKLPVVAMSKNRAITGTRRLFWLGMHRVKIRPFNKTPIIRIIDLVRNRLFHFLFKLARAFFSRTKGLLAVFRFRFHDKAKAEVSLAL